MPMRRVWVAWLLSGAVTSAQAATATALFAGGCFWCLEADFEKLAGVVAVESGYTAGKTTNPTYETVARGHTGHAEAVRVTYDPARVSYPQLVDYFWRQIDPTVKDRQFCDLGDQYRSGIYWGNAAERQAVLDSRDALQLLPLVLWPRCAGEAALEVICYLFDPMVSTFFSLRRCGHCAKASTPHPRPPRRCSCRATAGLLCWRRRAATGGGR